MWGHAGKGAFSAIKLSPKSTMKKHPFCHSTVGKKFQMNKNESNEVMRFTC